MQKIRFRHAALLCSGISLLLLLSSCLSQQSAATNYYVLAYFPSESSPRFEKSVFEGALSVLEPSIDPVFDRRQVVRRISPTRLRYLSSELWAVTLPDAFQRAVRDGVARSGAFSEVYRAARDIETRYHLAVVVDAVELIDPAAEADAPGDAEREPVVHLELTLQLVDGAATAVVSRNELSYREPLAEGGDIAAYVDQLSRVLSRSVDELLAAASDSGNR